MTKIIESRRKLKSRLDAKQDVSDSIPALMGDGNGVIDAPNQPGYVYIRVGDGDLGQAFNNRVPRVDKLAIDVGYDPITDPARRIFQVLNVRMADYAGGGSTPYPNVGPHHELHEFGGGDDTYISWRRLMGFRVGRPSVFNVTVDEGNIIRAGAWQAVLAQTVALAAFQAPLTSGQGRYVLIALDSTGVATATPGAIVPIGTLDISDCPIPAAGEIPLAAVRLYGTQTSIGDIPTAPDIIDLRFPQAACNRHGLLSTLQPGTAQYQVITSGPNPFPAIWSDFFIRGLATRTYTFPNVTGTVAMMNFANAGGFGIGIAPGALILNTYANNINESITFQVENTAHAVVISRVDNGNVHMTFNNLTTGYTLTDGTDVGIEADGTFRIRQQENMPVEIYTNDTHRWTILATGHFVSGTAGAGIFNITTAGVITGATLNLSAASNQIVFQSAGVTGTLTWTPATSNKIVTIPNATGNMALHSINNVFTANQTVSITGAIADVIFMSSSTYARLQLQGGAAGDISCP